MEPFAAIKCTRAIRHIASAMRCQDDHPDCVFCHGECHSTATEVVREIGTPHIFEFCSSCTSDALDSGLYERPEALIDAIADAEIDDYLLRKHHQG